MTFRDLKISPNIQRALAQEQYTVPTPIQEQAIPPALAGRDLMGIAQTGTGKTAAFAVPILQNLAETTESSHNRQVKRPVRALILTPTRELALQIHESFAVYGRFSPLRSAVVFGGVSQKPQEEALFRGVDILTATPGRLKDLMNQGLVDLSRVEILTLDEADRMLDMGFIHDVRFIIARTPAKKQTLFFSATMPAEIISLSRSLLVEPVRVSITPDKPTVEKIDQSVYLVNKHNKRLLLIHLLKDSAITSALVFTRTKHGADRVVRELLKNNLKAQAIHGNKSQNARQMALDQFKNRSTRILVATDIAARGIDIDELSHVINFDLPEISETYIHRIGRTGRAGLGGVAISFCDQEEIKLLKDIEKLCGKIIPRIDDHPYPLVSQTNPVEVLPDQGSTARRQPELQRQQRPARPLQTQNRPTENRSAGNRPAESRSTENRSAGTRPAENRPAENRSAGTRPADGRPVENRPAENRPASGRRRRSFTQRSF